MITASGPVIKREYNTAGTPNSIVSGSASPKDNPTGTKSHPTWASIANNAGRAYCNGIALIANCCPNNTPTVEAITAPGPKIGDKNGIPQTTLITSNPGNVPHNGAMVLAMIFPNPLALIIPNKVDVKAMNGNTLRMIMSIESRPAAKNLLTTCPTPIPIRVMIPGLLTSWLATISALACSLDLGPSAAAI